MRETLKRLIPGHLASMAKHKMLAILNPPADEEMYFLPSAQRDGDTRPRLTLVLPYFDTAQNFGGVNTGLEIFAELFASLKRDLGGSLDARILVCGDGQAFDRKFVADFSSRHGMPLTCDDISRGSHETGVRAREIFVTYNWWTTLAAEMLNKAQSGMFGREPLPLVYLVQDYEPQFYPFGSAHMLAREALDRPQRLWRVVNSSQIHGWLGNMGHRAERDFVFEPVVNQRLRDFLDQPGPNKRKQILVYGRKPIARNCWPALIRGLQQFVETYPGIADWDLLSAGLPHPPVDLGRGKRLQSVGKLSLDDYARTLGESSVGVSLMASPHPSYPPLEMAHFGIRTLTNKYAIKDLATFHPNIVSLDSIDAVALSDALAAACNRYAEAPSDYRNPEYMRLDRLPFMPELAGLLVRELEAGGSPT